MSDMNAARSQAAITRLVQRARLSPLQTGCRRAIFTAMKIEGLRSPGDEVDGIVYFGRMIDKIRLHAEGKLSDDYVENLGSGFDGRCTRFLKVNYADLVERVKMGGGTDMEILQWCYNVGQRPEDEQKEVWNEFMRKIGWRDKASERVKMRLEEAGLADRTDIVTMFDFIDLDEGR